VIKFVYKLFLGVLLAATIGMGIATFYPAPEMPKHPSDKYPHSSSEPSLTGVPSPEQIEKQREYDEDYEQYNKQRERHDRNTAVIAVAVSLGLLLVSLTALTKIEIMADGVLLGGIFSLLYGIVRSFGSGDQKFIFVATLIGLIAALVLGYFKFVKSEELTKHPKHKS